MIYTVTLNPAIDYIVTMNNFKMGVTNRVQSEQMVPGGKGLNVSILLHNLGMENIALGFIAGFTGREIRDKFQRLGGTQKFIEVPNGNSRINVKIQSSDGTEINGRGPVIDDNSLNKFWRQIDELAYKDILVLSGNVPDSLPKNIYKQIIQKASEKEVLVIVDTTEQYLREVLEYKPFLIKPNIQELEEILHIRIENTEQTIALAKKLQDMGAQNVIVSMGKDGAIFVDENKVIHQSLAPKGKLVNSVGAGDSMIAGFLYEWLRSHDYESAFKMAIAAGSATAFTEKLATKEAILALYN